MALLREAVKLGDLGMQYCIKSKRAYDALGRPSEPIEQVSKDVYLERFNMRDSSARRALLELIDSDGNTLKDTFGNHI